MTNPTQAKYIGPVEQLKGCSALVRPCDLQHTLEVQFTDVNARSPNECAGKKDVTDLEQLMFGWHEMPLDHFEMKQAKAKKAPTPKAMVEEDDDG
ncbi:hypothetical protein FDH82_gp36 [Roseobacter phage RDJL Phi 2]|uniref:Uncharacterized protein n=1 Tax=Roseobacter phage RDJL Phi 2 TaxID=1682380 RepID=A0A0K0PVH0_9CAUD|nr:hypothetical protein FDH82_gp36 [Roseobacter phage RDJL Phi 2]AKQ75826.1 hypothetical protein RDJLphi2_gp36 [Roseobacter phage RDJL Phi 2]